MSRPTVRVLYWTSSEAKMYPLFSWDSLTVSYDQFTATASLTVRQDHQIVGLGYAANSPSKAFFEHSLWVYYGATLLFWGPCIDLKLVGGASTSDSRVELQFEDHVQHALRRRMNWSQTQAYTKPATAAPNAILLDLIDDAMGGVAGPVSPDDYPAGHTRDDFNNWIYTAGAASGSPSNVDWSYQSGNNLLDVAVELCEKYDMIVTADRTAKATYNFNVEYPYQVNDKTGTIVLTPIRGTGTDWEVSYAHAYVNVARVGGDGEGASQTESWAHDNDSITDRGIYEDNATLPAGDADAINSDSAWILADLKDARYEYATRPLYTTVARPFLDYNWRDKVMMYHPDYGHLVEQTIIGYKLDARNGGRSWTVDLTIDNKAMPVLRMMRDRVGGTPGRNSGGRWKDKNG